MTKSKRICDMCGKDIEPYNDFNLYYNYGYESHDFDEATINLDLCGNCLDKLTHYIVDNCNYNNPVKRKYE